MTTLLASPDERLRMMLRFSADTSAASCGSTVHAHASVPASNFRGPARAVDAPHRRAVRCRVSCDVEIYRFACFRRKLRIRQEGKPRDRVEGRVGLAPLDAGGFDPEAGIPTLAPVRHLVDVEELDPKNEAAHFAILPEVPDEFVLQALRITPLQRTGRIVRGWRGRVFHHIDWSVTKSDGAPITQLLVGLDGLARLHLCQSERPRHSQLVPEWQGPQSADWI